MNLLRSPENYFSKVKIFGQPIHYSWIVMLITFFTLLVAAGIRATPAVVIVPFEMYFGWSRTFISFALAINLLLFGLCGPFTAALMELYGVRYVMNFALLLLAIGSGLSIFMNAPWHMIVLWGIIVGTGTGLLSAVLGSIIATRWFVEHKGMVIGIFSAASAAGQLIFLPLFAKLLETYTWQSIFYFIFCTTLLFMALVSIFMRNKPSDVGLLPYGASETTATVPVLKENPFLLVFNALRIAVSSKDFWLLSGSFFVCGATTIGIIGTHFVPACIDHGIPEIAAAGMLSVAGIFNILGTTLSGWLSDKFDNRWLLFWYYSLRGLSLIFLTFELTSNNAMIIIFIVFYGLDWIATVPPTIRLATEIFGSQGNIIFGWMMTIHAIGAALAAFSGGALYTALGNYQWTFISGGLLCAIAAGLVLKIRSPLAPAIKNA